jgi:23S rRNA maturation mini-RNase III
MTVTAVLAALGAAIAAMVAAYFKGAKAGRNSEIVKRAQADANKQAQFDAIDNRAPDLDDAVDRLRKRAGNGSAPS